MRRTTMGPCRSLQEKLLMIQSCRIVSSLPQCGEEVILRLLGAPLYQPHLSQVYVKVIAREEKMETNQNIKKRTHAIMIKVKGSTAPCKCFKIVAMTCGGADSRTIQQERHNPAGNIT